MAKHTDGLVLNTIRPLITESRNPENDMDAKNSFYKNAFVNVPLNERGRLAVAGDGYVEFINEDFASMNYACAEHDALTDLFFAYNDTFNILIDDCEDELLPADKVRHALEMARTYLQKAEDIHKPQIEKFIRLLELAQRTNMPVSFNL